MPQSYGMSPKAQRFPATGPWGGANGSQLQEGGRTGTSNNGEVSTRWSDRDSQSTVGKREVETHLDRLISDARATGRLPPPNLAVLLLLPFPEQVMESGGPFRQWPRLPGAKL